jgi:hypothetical protein
MGEFVGYFKGHIRRSPTPLDDILRPEETGYVMEPNDSGGVDRAGGISAGPICRR